MSENNELIEKCKKIIDAGYQLAKESRMTPAEANQYVSNAVGEVYPRYKEARAFTEGDEKQVVLQYQSIRGRQYTQWYGKASSAKKTAKKSTPNEKVKILLWPLLCKMAETGSMPIEKQAIAIFEPLGYPSNSISAMYSMLRQKYVFSPVYDNSRCVVWVTKPDPVSEKIRQIEEEKNAAILKANEAIAKADAEIAELKKSKKE